MRTSGKRSWGTARQNRSLASWPSAIARVPAAEIERERLFILALSSLETLRSTPRGGMSIDPEEIRDQILVRREAFKHLVDPAHRYSL